MSKHPLAENTRKSITILLTSDLHGQIAYETEETTQGFVRTASYIASKQQEGSLLLIDNGDFLQGNHLSTFYYQNKMQHTHPIIEVMNLLKYDGAVLGNHEFDFSLDYLKQNEQASDFPWLAANVVHRDSGTPFFGEPYFIKTFHNGVSVAVLGLTHHHTPFWTNIDARIQFLDPVTCAKEWVKKLQDTEAPDIIVLAYHGGLSEEGLTGNAGIRLCQEVPGFHVLLTGHEHYTLVEKHHGVTIVQPGSHGGFVGEICVELSGTTVHSSATVIDGQQESIHSETFHLYKSRNQKVSYWLDSTVGTLHAPLLITNHLEACTRPHPYVQFLHDVQKSAMKTKLSVAAIFHEDTYGLPKQIKVKHILHNYSYRNRLVVKEITGHAIKQALERSATYFIWKDSKLTLSRHFPHYLYDMWDGLTYEIDPRKETGHRIKIHSILGEPFAPDKQYEVTMSEYRALGSNGYEMLASGRTVRESTKDMASLIMDFIKNHPNYKPMIHYSFNIRGEETNETCHFNGR
ncbi:hypothetical protein Q73_00435 [Bacillus coahuilensis m2-6]|uniref:bifunctional metallophosphatase/5'-nucleotidase n=1 Tax=Bacillus coahuilensis TaxID=408580 RepID=UPI000185097F|nr:bifunctional UDP-sugar hydrolase/5'-nucleotidase [Bacillus coahuilensis]KUP09940.1 hypothetical protein Q73_00435 [Bacillus coahuilensis m2-6]